MAREKAERTIEHIKSAIEYMLSILPTYLKKRMKIKLYGNYKMDPNRYKLIKVKGNAKIYEIIPIAS